MWIAICGVVLRRRFIAAAIASPVEGDIEMLVFATWKHDEDDDDKSLLFSHAGRPMTS
jgi:hypothetical protein